MKISNDSTLTLWAVLYSLTLFVSACGLLFFIKRFPTHQFFLIGCVIAMFLVVLHIGIRQYAYAKYIAKLKKDQSENIVPGHCPDYWNKKTTARGVSCVNQFVQTKDGVAKEVRFGTNATPNDYDIRTFSNLSNQAKCTKIATAGMPWVDMDIKCEAARAK